MDATVVVGTFGEERWVRLANQRAIPSAEALGVPVIHRHGETLAQARNEGLALVDTEWVVHLDADDELPDDYLVEMEKGNADIRAPSRQDVVRGSRRGVPYVPKVWGHDHDCVAECLRYGNWITIGAAVRTELAVEWEEFGWSEDYAFFARIWKNGGTVEALPGAVYIAHWSPSSRNHVQNHVGVDWHRKIEAAVWPNEPSVL